MTNGELERIVDTSDEWIKTRTGIIKRHIAAENETTCDLAEHAALKAIAASGINPGKIDLIIIGTTTPDVIFPSTACLLQKRLGIHGCPAFDVQAVCTGFIYALDIADKFIRTGAATTALVIGAETLSRILDWKDRSTCVLFGDGEYNELLQVPAGISRYPEKLKNGTAFIQMQGNEVFKVAVNTLVRIVDETLEANHLEKEDIDWLVPHQANTRIISATAKKLNISMDRVILTVDQHGNTSAASVPLALDVAVRDGRIQRGDTLLLEAFGGGLTWGATLVKY